MHFASLLTLALATSAFAAPVADPAELAFANRARHDDSHVYRIQVTPESYLELDAFVEAHLDQGIEFWSRKFHTGHVDVYVPAASQPLFSTNVLAKNDHKLMIDNVQSLVDAEQQNTVRAMREVTPKLQELTQRDRARDGSVPFDVQELPDMWGAYFREQAWKDYFGVVMSSVPSAEIRTIGTTYKGNAITAYKVGTGRREIVATGALHAREYITVSVVSGLLNWFLTSPDAQKYLEKFTLTFVPVANPDGYDYTFSGNRMHRKNLVPGTSNPRCLGTDPNRNFAHKWGGAGASASECSDTYRGTGPLSAAEAKALNDYVLARKPNVVGYYDIHSYSQMWLWPWAWSCSQRVEDDQDLTDGAKVSLDALKAVYGTSFVSGPTCNTIYQIAGDVNDHQRAIGGVKYSYGIELRDTGRYGFILPEDQIKPSVTEFLAAFRSNLDYIIQKERL